MIVVELAGTAVRRFGGIEPLIGSEANRIAPAIHYLAALFAARIVRVENWRPNTADTVFRPTFAGVLSGDLIDETHHLLPGRFLFPRAKVLQTR